ncbi:hypothetical protein H6P81_003189 [Aristolochia fimbriata]|uniref:Uncharacterized protein n=1 Tax=Aristolochia fimbriata TaxID=158543 RepID=A0AAV7FF23_ARIFI|nr:hypothetical protein H6P81_003189 [Aristolochia fimbriata]
MSASKCCSSPKLMADVGFAPSGFPGGDPQTAAIPLRGTRSWGKKRERRVGPGSMGLGTKERLTKSRGLFDASWRAREETSLSIMS